MNVLAFDSPATVEGGRRVRAAKFEARSALASSAMCLVANAMRETLASILGAPASLRAIGPVLPGAAAWEALIAHARTWCVRGAAGEAALVLRPADALALAAAAFGEEAAAPRELSAVEAEVLARAVRALAPALAPLCGRDAAPPEPILDIRGYATYFELLVERPAVFRLGIALAREPEARGGATLRLEDLAQVEIELSAEFARGSLCAGALLALGPGAVVPMTTRMGEPGLLKAGAAVFARGQCGAAGERAAMIVGA